MLSEDFFKFNPEQEKLIQSPAKELFDSIQEPIVKKQDKSSSEIYLEEGKIEQANKILERANKKFPKNYFVETQKNKLKHSNN